MLDLEKKNILKNELKGLLHDNNKALNYFEKNGYFFIENYRKQLNDYVTYLIDHIENIDINELKNIYHQVNDIDELINYNYVIVRELWSASGTTSDYLTLSEDQTKQLIQYMKELQN